MLLAFALVVALGCASIAESRGLLVLGMGVRVFITNVKGTFLGMSESEEASKRR